MAKSAKQTVVSGKPMYCKVSEKGAVSLYGMRRFPTTFYKDEWLTLFAKADAIKKFMAAHADELKEKEDATGGVEGAEMI